MTKEDQVIAMIENIAIVHNSILSLGGIALAITIPVIATLLIVAIVVSK